MGQASNPPSQVTAPPNAPIGIGGWMLVFVIGQGVSTLLNLQMLKQAALSLQPELWALGERFPIYRPLAVVELLYALLLVLGPPVGIALTLARKKAAPHYWRWFLTLAAVFALSDLIGTSWFHVQLKPYLAPVKVAEVSRQMVEAERKNIGVIMIGIVWGLYWLRSRRVRNTFGLPETVSFLDRPVSSLLRPQRSSPTASSSSPLTSRTAKPDDAPIEPSQASVEPDDERVRCPWCAEWILKQARICKHCHQPLTPSEPSGQ